MPLSHRFACTPDFAFCPLLAPLFRCRKDSGGEIEARQGLPGFSIRERPECGEEAEGVEPARKRANLGEPPAGNGGADVLPEKAPAVPACRNWSPPLGAGGFGETPDGFGFVVVDVKDSIEFGDL